MRAFFAQIPYSVQLPQEKYYQSIFYVLMRLTGAKISAEEMTNNGRIDAIIENNNQIFIFEFKIDQDPQKALKQIEDKQYFQKFLQSNKEIHLVGVQFDSNQRNIGHWVSSIISRSTGNE